MAYNFSLKKYANGTVQMTYYDFPILDSFDRECIDYNGYDKSPCFENIPEYDDNWTPWGVVEEQIQNIGENENDCNNNDITLSDEELAKKHERCIESSVNRSVRRIYDLGRDNTWDWFFTFTLNEQAVSDRLDYQECSSKVCKWFNNLKARKCPHIKYLIVPERHPTSGAWHFHALVSNVEELDFKVAINNAEYRKDKYGNVMYDKKGQPKRNKYFGQKLRVSYPDGNYIYNIVNFDENRYGFSEATKIVDTRRAVSYIVKYLTKELGSCTFGKNRYFASKNLTTPEKECLLEQKASIQDIITFVEQKYNVSLENDYMKTVKIRQPGYCNTVTYMEFNSNE